MLWDLAGQTDYQVVHQIFLDQTSEGIVLFDATHPENPFAGVGYWEKAIRKAAGRACPLILAAGAVDRGQPTVSQDDIQEYINSHQFIGFIATSSKTGEGVEALRQQIIAGIPWERLPITSSPDIWQDMRSFLLQRRNSSDVVVRRTELWDSFVFQYPASQLTSAEFETIIGHAQTQGLVWRLSFGDLILLKPEILNNYASAVVLAARTHPHGLGCVGERDVLGCPVRSTAF